MGDDSQPEERLTEHEPSAQLRRAAFTAQSIEALRGQVLNPRTVVLKQCFAQRDLEPVLNLGFS